ncbi:hypothetical protein Plhal304r1_c029g0095291 [Plasmopara halstedii]
MLRSAHRLRVSTRLGGPPGFVLPGKLLDTSDGCLDCFLKRGAGERMFTVWCTSSAGAFMASSKQQQCNTQQLLRCSHRWVL